MLRRAPENRLMSLEVRLQCKPCRAVSAIFQRRHPMRPRRTLTEADRTIVLKVDDDNCYAYLFGQRHGTSIRDKGADYRVFLHPGDRTCPSYAIDKARCISSGIGPMRACAQIAPCECGMKRLATVQLVRFSMASRFTSVARPLLALLSSVYSLARIIHEHLLQRPILSPGEAFLVQSPRRTASTPVSPSLARSLGGTSVSASSRRRS
jgi:hypothetical protein